MRGKGLVGALIVGLLVAATATTVRLLDRDLCLEIPGQEGWVSYDPDGLYHMRRVERAFEEGLPVAGTDPILNHPEGAPIPWPPYYTYLLWGLMAPFAPEEIEARRAFVEHFTGSLPVALGVLTACLAALAAGLLAGRTAAAFAGGYCALLMASILYSRLGNGDHHAFVSLLQAAMLLLLSVALRGKGIGRPRRCALLGVAAGALAGLGLGSWVAFLLYVLEVQVLLGILLWMHARRPRAGTAALGLGFHLAALAVVLPAAIASPWNQASPWTLVNLSWFHPTWLLLGALVFLPLPFLGRGSTALRRYPWIAAAGLAAAAAALLISPAGAGVREALQWASGSNPFMSNVQESSSLFQSGPSGRLQLFDWLGWASPLLPIAWIAMLAALLRGRDLALLPWIVAVPLLALQAGAQMRFAEPLAMPLAVALGAWLGPTGERMAARRKLSPWMAVAGGLLLAAAAQWHTLQRAADQIRSEAPPQSGLRREQECARGMCSWLSERPPPAAGAGVLAHWGFGHMIEWVAGRPTVATNFGSYIGAESFADPSAFFLTEDPEEAEAILRRRGAGHVLLSSQLVRQLPNMIQSVSPRLHSTYLRGRPGRWRGGLQERWFRTVGCRMLIAGAGGEPPQWGVKEPLRFLRLVHASPIPDPQSPLQSFVKRTPAGWIWEVVPGAVLTARGAPGAELSVELAVEYREAGLRLRHADRVQVGEDGTARLRLPYCTEGANGDGRVAPGAVWWLGRSGARRPLVVGQQAVLQGETIRLQ